jgi:hypothetical protein
VNVISYVEVHIMSIYNTVNYIIWYFVDTILTSYFNNNNHTTTTTNIPPPPPLPPPPPSSSTSGVIITQLVFPEGYSEPLLLWMPDLFFRDASSVVKLATVFRIRQHGELYMAKHELLTLAQPNLDFKKYPNDHQEVELVFQSVAYSNLQVQLNYSDPAVLYVATPNGKDVNFEKNVIWLHKAGGWVLECWTG